MKKKILVVDDEKIYRLLITKILSAAGYDILEADNAEKAIEMTKSILPDLVVCDMKMPGGNGLEVLEAIKSDNTTLKIPFIFLTSQSDSADQNEALKSGASEYLLKPVNKDQLLSAINTRML